MRLAALPVICMLHCIGMAFHVEMPFGLLYGPLLYFIWSGKGSIQHFIPFIAFSFLYLLLMFGSSFNLPWIMPLLVIYTKVRLVVVALSLVSYSIVVNFFKNEATGTNGILIKKLGAVFMISSLVIAIIVIGSEENTRPLIAYPQYMLAVCIFLLVVMYMRARLIDDKSNAPEDIDIVKLKESLEARRLYLNPGINLDMLANDTTIPKSDLTQVINAYSGKTFYHLIAWYRIRYVADRLAKDDKRTIEALAYESGFNSKTSLNKYFREFTGLTPSEFRSGKPVDHQFSEILLS